MIFITSIILVIKLFMLERLSFVNGTLNNSTDEHVCYSEETYVELVRTPIQQPVKVRSYNWCLEFPPRCSNYKTEIREVIKVQNETRTKLIEHCCDGFAEVVFENETICKPICRGGCGRGYCMGPNECKCDVGYTGRHCTQRCRHGRWGDGCKNNCKCRNGALCDNKNGLCRCNEGWIGDFCDQPCTNGYYGLMCKNICECSTNKCNPLTGECTIEESVILFDWTTNQTDNIMKIPNERIDAEQWIKVEINNSTDEFALNSDLVNATTSIIESLNSTIANLTENIDKLAKNLNETKMQMTTLEPIALLVSNPILEITTIKTIQEVILINGNNQQNSVLIKEKPTIVDVGKPIMATNPEVIHVITNWQEHLYDIHRNDTEIDHNLAKGHDLSAVISVLVIFAIIILVTLIGFVILYRRYLRKTNQRSYSSEETEQSNEGSKVFTKPLPDLPSFTQNISKSYVPEFYDCPSNNSIVKASTGPYTYITGSVYSEPPTPYQRKESLDHLYDEIKYPTVQNSEL